jgi:cytochrome P450
VFSKAANVEASSMSESTAPVLGNLFTPEFINDPYPTYRLIRETNPFLKLPGGNDWIAVRYEDCAAVLRDKRFGIDNDRRMKMGVGDDYMSVPAYASLSRTMLFSDPPAHTRLRKLVVRAFDARSIEKLRGQIRKIAAGLVDRMENSSSGDLMTAFARQLPIEVICEMLGIPKEDRHRFTAVDENAGRILDPTPMTPEELAEANRNTLEGAAYFDDLCERRRREPTDDLLTAMVQSETEHGKLTREELSANISLLFGAGHETTVNLIGNGLLALYRNRDQLELLQNDPSLIPNAIEELLRYDSSVQLSGRTALEDAEICGQRIEAGAQIVTIVGAANRDPEVYANPESLDVTRQNIRPLSFGGGIHHCLGAQLARIEGTEAFSELLGRLPRLELDDVVNAKWKPTITLRGLVELPAHW